MEWRDGGGGAETREWRESVREGAREGGREGWVGGERGMGEKDGGVAERERGGGRERNRQTDRHRDLPSCAGSLLVYTFGVYDCVLTLHERMQNTPHLRINMKRMQHRASKTKQI